MMFLVTGGFILLDMVTGLVKAFKEKAYTSSVMREGLYHKCGSVLFMVLGSLGEYAQTIVDIGVSVPLASVVCTYIILMEVGSIVENLGKIDPRIIPAKIKPYFQKLSDGEAK